MNVNQKDLLHALNALNRKAFKRGMKNNDIPQSMPHDYAHHVLLQGLPGQLALTLFDAQGHGHTRTIPVVGDEYGPFNIWLYFYPLRETVKLADKGEIITLSNIRADDYTPLRPLTYRGMQQKNATYGCMTLAGHGWRATVTGQALALFDMLTSATDVMPLPRSFAEYNLHMARQAELQVMVTQAGIRTRIKARREARRRLWQKPTPIYTAQDLGLPKQMTA